MNNNELRTDFSWLIEQAGPSWLAARKLGGWEFYWTEDAAKAIRFIDREQADAVLEVARQLVPTLFPSCLPRSVAAVEHGFHATGVRE